MSWGYGYREYVPVAQRKAQGSWYAIEHARKQGRAVQPVMIRGKKIATTFWGKAWCDHLESYSDYANRLPRGRTYVRNGSVVDLAISAGRVEALVAGSDTYEVDIRIDRLTAADWKKIRNDCSASIDSLLDLLGGKFSAGVMTRLTRRPDGLFPTPKEIKLDCSCPDWATMCKHVAAVLYGVGAHLDQRPELLFLLRHVDHTELVSEAVSAGNLSTALGEPSSQLAGEDLGAMFGIDLDVSADSSTGAAAPAKRRSPAKKKPAATSTPKKAVPRKKSAPKKSVAKKPEPSGDAVGNGVVSQKAVKKKAAGKKATKKKVARKKVARKKVAKKSAATKKTAAPKVVVKKSVKKKAATNSTTTKTVKKKAARSKVAKKKAVKKKTVARQKRS
ncbi:MAG: SWIM zinc finger family protein [Rhodopirellula sp.]|nr:SWIM zinc finger family protein [Rhodopirellula sp.]